MSLLPILFDTHLKLFSSFFCNFQCLVRLEIYNVSRLCFFCADHGVCSLDKLFSHPSRLQLVVRQSNLVQLFNSLYLACSQALSRREFVARSQEYFQRPGPNLHRPALAPVHLGAVSQSQGSSQIPHLAESQGLYCCLHSHQRCEDAGAQLTGFLGLIARGVISRPSQFFALVSNVSSERLLCDPRQKQHVHQARLLGKSGHEKHHDLRSIHCPERTVHCPLLPCAPEANPVERFRSPKVFTAIGQQISFLTLTTDALCQSLWLVKLLF